MSPRFVAAGVILVSWGFVLGMAFHEYLRPNTSFWRRYGR